MLLSELPAANGLLDDGDALAQRYEEDGCLLVRGALDPVALGEVTGQATEVLERRGLAQRRDGVRWTGQPVPQLDGAGIDGGGVNGGGVNGGGVNGIAALDALVRRIDDGTDPLREVARRVCGRPMTVWRALHLFTAIPDDPAYVTPPHQDNFAVRDTGDYRRLWIALTDMPFGDGGLGLAVGSHRSGRLPQQPLAEFADRPASGQAGPPSPATGIDPALVGDHWHTAGMQPGDLLVFRPELVHRGLPASSDRIRLALSVIVSGTGDPRPPVLYTGPENRARRHRVRQLTTGLGLSDQDIYRISAELNRAGSPVDEDTVRRAVSSTGALDRKH